MEEAMIKELSRLIGDAIDTALDDFRERLHRQSKAISMEAYQVLVNVAVHRAASQTLSRFDDAEWRDRLAARILTPSSCSWCHTTNPRANKFCRVCGHMAQVSREQCWCLHCRQQRTVTEDRHPLGDEASDAQRSRTPENGQAPPEDRP
jgi:hypothetical protein